MANNIAGGISNKGVSASASANVKSKKNSRQTQNEATETSTSQNKTPLAIQGESPGAINPPIDPRTININQEIFFANARSSNVSNAYSLGSFSFDIDERLLMSGEDVTVVAINPDFKATNDHPVYGKQGGDAYLSSLASGALEYCESVGIKGAKIYKDGTSFYLLVPPGTDLSLLSGLDSHLMQIDSVEVRDKVTGEPLGKELLRIEDPHVKTAIVVVRPQGGIGNKLNSIVVMDALDKIACSLNSSESSMGVIRVEDYIFEGAEDRQLARARDANRNGQNEIADWMARKLVVDHLMENEGMSRSQAESALNQRPDLLLLGYEKLSMQYIDPQSGLLTYDVFIEYSLAQSRQGKNMYVVAMDGNRFSAFRTTFPFPVGPNAQSLVARERAAWAIDSVREKYAGQGVEIALFRRGPGSDEFFLSITMDQENPELMDQILKDYDSYINQPLWLEVTEGQLLEYLNKLPPEERAKIGLSREGVIESKHIQDINSNWFRKAGDRYLINITGDSSAGLEGAPRMRPVYFYENLKQISLEKLAKEIGIPVDVLAQENGLPKNTILKPGDKIKIPGSYYKRFTRNNLHAERLIVGCEVYRGIHMDSEYKYLAAEEINSMPSPERGNFLRKTIDKLELSITNRKTTYRKNLSNVEFYKKRLETESPEPAANSARGARGARSANPRTSSDVFYVNGQPHANRPTGEAYHYVDGAQIDAEGERVNQTRMKNPIAPADSVVNTGEIKVVGQRTFGAALVGVVVEIPLSMLEQWNEDGTIDYDQVLSDAGKSGTFLAAIGGGQYMAVKVGIPEGGAVRILFVLPATAAAFENPEDIGIIATGTALNYGTFEAGMKMTPGPWWAKLAGGLIFSRLGSHAYESLLSNNPEIVDFLKSDTGKAVGTAIGIGSWAWIGYDLLGGPGAFLVTLLWPSAIGHDFGGQVISGGVYDLATGKQTTEIEHPNAATVNDSRPNPNIISLERSNIPMWERTEWTSEDMLFQGNQRLHFETYLYLYKLGYISRDEVISVFGEDVAGEFDGVNFSDPESYKDAYEEWSGEWNKLCSHTQYSDKRELQEQILVRAIKLFKTDVAVFTSGQEQPSGDISKFMPDGSADVYGSETAFWLMFVLEQNEAQKNAAIAETESEQRQRELTTPQIINGRNTGD